MLALLAAICNAIMGHNVCDFNMKSILWRELQPGGKDSHIFSILVSFKLEPHPDWFPLGVLFKISVEHPRPFHSGVPSPPPRGAVVIVLE